jgi:hypothetical protein
MEKTVSLEEYSFILAQGMKADDQLTLTEKSFVEDFTISEHSQNNNPNSTRKHYTCKSLLLDLSPCISTEDIKSHSSKVAIDDNIFIRKRSRKAKKLSSYFPNQKKQKKELKSKVTPFCIPDFFNDLKKPEIFIKEKKEVKENIIRIPNYDILDFKNPPSIYTSKDTSQKENNTDTKFILEHFFCNSKKESPLIKFATQNINNIYNNIPINIIDNHNNQKNPFQIFMETDDEQYKLINIELDKDDYSENFESNYFYSTNSGRSNSENFCKSINEYNDNLFLKFD